MEHSKGVTIEYKTKNYDTPKLLPDAHLLFVYRKVLGYIQYEKKNELVEGFIFSLAGLNA